MARDHRGTCSAVQSQPSSSSVIWEARRLSPVPALPAKPDGAAVPALDALQLSAMVAVSRRLVLQAAAIPARAGNLRAATGGPVELSARRPSTTHPRGRLRPAPDTSTGLTVELSGRLKERAATRSQAVSGESSRNASIADQDGERLCPGDPAWHCACGQPDAFGRPPVSWCASCHYQLARWTAHYMRQLDAAGPAPSLVVITGAKVVRMAKDRCQDCNRPHKGHVLSRGGRRLCAECAARVDCVLVGRCWRCGELLPVSCAGFTMPCQRNHDTAQAG